MLATSTIVAGKEAAAERGSSRRQHMPVRRILAGTALAACVAMLAAACAVSSGEKTIQSTSDEVVRGGTPVLTIGSDPGCADWLAPCGATASGAFSMAVHTIPRAFDVVDGVSRPSALLAGEPTVDAGPRPRITYRLNPKAVWSDGMPITSADFRYTWDQFVNGAGVRTTVGYDRIADVDDSDPRKVVVTLRSPYAPWRELFSGGGLVGVLPKHLLEGKDRGAELRSGYRWSGGPWLIDHWTPNQEVKLVPNPAYWGDKPRLAAVVFKILTDPSAQLQAFKSGQVAILSSIPPEVTTAELRKLPDTRVEVAPGLGMSALAFNTQKPPLDSVAVRQALAYATDRDTIVRQLYGPLDAHAKPLQSWVTPASRGWSADSFTRYRRDLGQVDRLMGGEGWAKDPEGRWRKEGEPARVELLGYLNPRRDPLLEQILQSQWQEAGFEVSINNVAQALGTDARYKGAFSVLLETILFRSPDPSRCYLFCSDYVPSPANANTGTNITRIADPALDEALHRVETEFDKDERQAAVVRSQRRLAELMPGLPIVASPAVLVYNTARLRGVTMNTGPLGWFFNMHEWWCAEGRC